MRIHDQPAPRWRRSATSLALLVLAACGGSELSEYVTLQPDSRLLSKVQLTTLEPDEPGEVALWVAPQAGWRELLLIDPCGPFHPGMSFAEAEAELGPPDERGGSDRGAWVEYRRDGLRYRIGSYTFATGSIPFLLPEDEASYQEWVLETRPVANRVGDVFVPEVAAYIDGNREHAVILGPDGPAVHAPLAGLDVLYLHPTRWAGCGPADKGT